MIIRHQISLTDATGGEDGPRTHDLLNAIQTLSQTELQPHIVIPKTVCNQSLDASYFSLRLTVKKKRVLYASSLVARHKVSTPTFMVPKAGLEPARVTPPDFESGTSTNSITRANKTHLSIPRPPASVGSSYHEFQKLTRLTLSVSRPVSGFTGKPIRVFVFSLFKTRILYKNRPLVFPF